MSTILDAIYNISQQDDLNIKEVTFGNNRANNMGEGLESFVKDAFTNTFNEPDKNKRNLEYNKVFSFQGSKRNPPDLMLKNGAALEIKKIEKKETELQLNSSHPKQTLKSTSPFITKKCKNCEEWDERDFVYVIGHVEKSSLSTLWFIYGGIYAASEDTYISLKKDITENIEKNPNIEFPKTKELGRVNQVDPLKITNLRIRGMWLLQAPFKVFDYVFDYDPAKKFRCYALIPNSIYNEFTQESKSRINDPNTNIFISEVKVNDPDNSENLIDCKLVTFSV